MAQTINRSKRVIIFNACKKYGPTSGTFKCTANPDTTYPEWILEFKGLQHVWDRAGLMGSIQDFVRKNLAEMQLDTTLIANHMLCRPNLTPSAKAPLYEEHENELMRQTEANAKLSKNRSTTTSVKSTEIWKKHGVVRQTDWQIAAHVARDMAVASAAVHHQTAVADALILAAIAEDVAAMAAAAGAKHHALLFAEKQKEKQIKAAASEKRRAEATRLAEIAAALAAMEAEKARQAEVSRRRAAAMMSLAYWNAQLVVRGKASIDYCSNFGNSGDPDSGSYSDSEEGCSNDSLLRLLSPGSCGHVW